MPRVWTEEQKQRIRETHLARREREKNRPRVALPPPRSGVSVDCSIRLDLDEMTRRMSGTQIRAVMHGIAQVLAVGGSR